MPRGSEELTNSRKEEIINACALLYETMSFKEITLKEIGEKTSFTRTSIYNYFQTKEEIFLALFQREYEAWIRDLKIMLEENEKMSVAGFSGALAHTLEKRGRLLKLLSMNHYDMEANSRMENLVAFKTAYGNSLRTLSCCLEKFFSGDDGQRYPGIYLRVLSIPVWRIPLYCGDGEAEGGDGGGRCELCLPLGL